jgi:hypothetical protein
MLVKGYTSLMESVIVTGFQVTEAYSILDLTKAVIARIIPSNFSAYEKHRHDVEN